MYTDVMYTYVLPWCNSCLSFFNILVGSPRESRAWFAGQSFQWLSRGNGSLEPFWCLVLLNDWWTNVLLKTMRKGSFSHCKWFRHSEFWCSLGLGNPRHFKTCGSDEVDYMYSKVIFVKLCKVQNLNIADFQYDGRKCANVMKRFSAYTLATMDIWTTLP